MRCMTMSDLNINWDEIIEKEALGIGDYDHGKILAVEAGNVITKKGTVDKINSHCQKTS